MKEKTTCVIIADGERAKFLAKTKGKLVPMLPTHHAAEDVAVHQDKDRHKPGRSGKGMGIKGLHSYPPHTDWYDFKKEEFSTKVAEIINNNLANYDQLILIAAPFVLGCLRQHLSAQAIAKVVLETPKDLTKAPLKKVINYTNY